MNHSTVRRMRLFAFFVFVVSCSIFVGARYNVAAEGSHANVVLHEPVAGEDSICGSRCLVFVCDHYRIPHPPLPEIVFAVQGTHVANGSSLQQLADYLGQRGLHTHALAISKAAALKWPHPIIVHLHGKSGEMGHFAVWLPESTRTRAVIWDGLAGRKTLASWELSDAVDAGVLLTSPVSITNPESSVVLNSDALAFYCACALLFGESVFVSAVLGRAQRVCCRGLSDRVLSFFGSYFRKETLP